MAVFATVVLAGCKSEPGDISAQERPPASAGGTSVAPPTFEPNGGTFSGSQQVALSTATASAVIHYTLDGSDPTLNSTPYSGPFTLTATTQVRAIAILNGTNGSSVASAQFVLEDATSNTPPVISPIAAQTATEEGVLTFQVQASDPDNVLPLLSATGLPDGATFIDNTDGTATFSWTTSLGDAGNYTFTVIATDGEDPSQAVSADIVISITTAEPPDPGPTPNQAPVITPIPDQSVMADSPLSFVVQASDADGTTPVLSATGLPVGATFVDQNNGSGLFSWTPTSAQITTHQFSVTAIDADDPTLTSSIIANIIVNVDDAINQPPEFADVFTGSPAETFHFLIQATDLNGTIPVISFSALPEGATFEDQGNGSALFNWIPNELQSGPHTFTAIATDAVDPALSTPLEITLVVNPTQVNTLGNLTHLWQFNESAAATTFANYIGGFATCSSCPSMTQDSPIQPERTFDGTGNLLTASFDENLAWDAKDDISLEIWMKKSSACLEEAAVGRVDPDSTVQWWLGCDNTGAAFTMVDASNNRVDLRGSTNITDNQWHHIAVVKKGANSYQLFVDGKQEQAQNSVTLTGNFVGNNVPLTIGGLMHAGTSTYFMGALDEVAIHGEALNAKTVAQHYNDGAIGLRRGLVAACQRNVRIAPLGDSITQGLLNRERLTYRPVLFKALESADYNISFIGANSDKEEFVDLVKSELGINNYDTRYSAQTGKTARDISEYVADRGNGNNAYNTALRPADVILLHAGTNRADLNMDPSDDAAENVGYVENILNNIDSELNENIVVVVAQIVQRRESPDTLQYTQNFNTALASMVNSRIASGDRLILVNQEAAVNDDTFLVNNPPDDVLIHPNQEGNARMADVWFEKLEEFLPVCP